jgi:8-oxo-dGTP diphosphatase
LAWDKPDKRHRIRCSLLITDGRRLLLVKHSDPSFYPHPYWTVPGGSLERGESLQQAGVREALEETGLTIDVGKLAYVRQLVSAVNDLSQVELLFLVTSFAGDASLDNVSPEEREGLLELRWFTQHEVADPSIIVMPKSLRQRFWDDLEADFPQTLLLAVDGPG